jgi:hypothetical protein
MCFEVSKKASVEMFFISSEERYLVLKQRKNIIKKSIWYPYTEERSTWPPIFNPSCFVLCFTNVKGFFLGSPKRYFLLAVGGGSWGLLARYKDAE